MQENFISVHEAMPPLNRLCEVKTISGSVHKARFFYDKKNYTFSWLRQRESDGVFIKVLPVEIWRLIETVEEFEKWLNSSSNNDENL